MSDPALLYAFRQNLVLAASAGTGKTHALVGVLVHLLLGASELGGPGLTPPLDPGRIVATTFSRKAAAEIRARLVTELERLAAGDPLAKYRADLDRALTRAGRAPWSDGERRGRARRALEGLRRARIGTLHGFATTIVQRFALELGLLPGFQLEDEAENRERTRVVIERVVERHAAADDPGIQALSRTAGGPDRLVALLERLLPRLAEDGRSAAQLAVSEDDAAILEARMREVIAAARACVADAKLGERAARAVAAWDEGNEDRLSAALEELFEVAKSASRAPAATAFFELRDALPRGSSDDNGARARKLVAAFRARHAFAAQAEATKRLLVACERELSEDGVRAQVLGFSDVLRAAREVLRDRPECAAILGAELDALLVDEFQDTSRLQRDLVSLVWEKDPRTRQPGAEATLAGIRESGLLVVGDRKQSIYAFRGADVAVFAELAVGLAGAPARVALGVAPGATWEPATPLADFLPLKENRRSSAPILAFANAFSARRFRPGAPPALYEIAYAEAIEDLVAPPGEERAGPVVRWLKVRALKGSSTRLDEAFAIAQAARAVIDAGEPLVRGARPEWRDLAVLAQTNKMLDACAYALAQADIPFVVAGSGFFTAREVADLIALLAAIVAPGDTLALLEVLRGPAVGARDETLLALTEPGRGLSGVEAWGEGSRWGLAHDDDRLAIRAARERILRLRRSADRLPPGALLREAVRAFALEEVWIQLPRGAQRVANARKLLRMADAERSARTLLDRLRDAALRETNETEAATFSEEDDAVRLLTVHASKGLDFPIVFVPEVGATGVHPDSGPLLLDFGDGRTSPRLSVRIADDDHLRLDPPSAIAALEEQRRRDRAERARLAYVAVTRASHAMYLVGDRRPPKEDSEAYAGTTAATLAALPVSVLVPAFVEDIAPSPPPARAHAAPVEAPPPLAPTWRALQLDAQALRDFVHCPRRYELLHLRRMPEPGRAAEAPLESPPSPLVLRDLAGRTIALQGPLEREPSTPAAKARIFTLADDLVRARWAGDFTRVTVARCREIGCGFIPFCHGTSALDPADR